MPTEKAREEAVLSLSSMTGYARAEAHEGAHAWVWEAKSVNGKGLDLRLRLPPGYDFLDPVVRERSAKALKRGNLQIGLTLSSDVKGVNVAVNEPLLEKLAQISQEWGQRYPQIRAARWDGLLAVRGVLESADAAEIEPESHGPALLAAFDALLAGLTQMRQTEGGRIGAVLTQQLEAIADLTARAGQSAALRPEAVRDRIKTQLAALMDAGSPVSEDRLAQELALLAVKADVREELDRLASHVAAARDLMSAGGAVGRKLDFLAQEFNREANTLCSKSQDVELTRIGLELKLVIDQFKEQVQNIE